MALFRDYKKIHFRHHKKSKHNTLVVGEDNKNYDYIKVTHTPKRDKTHKNNSFIKNPNKKDKSPSYYENKVRIDVKSNFHEKPIRSWVLSEEDFNQLIKFLKSKKK